MKNTKKILLIIITILSGILLLEGFLFLNIKISEKYETQMEGLPDLDIQNVREKKKDINDDLLRTRKEAIVISTLLFLFVLLYLRIGNRNTS